MNHGRYVVEITRPDFRLMTGKGVASFHRIELWLLNHVDVGRHTTLNIVFSKFEHVEPHAVNTRQRNELVAVSHRAQFTLELRDADVIQVLFPVKRG